MLRQIRKTTKKPLFRNGKKYVDTYSSSNAAALYPEERVTKINLVTQLVTQKISQRGVKQITLNKKKNKEKRK